MDASQSNITQGGVTLGEGASITLGAGDVVGRDKIVNNIQHIQQRALTAAEEASGERALETQVLAQGVSAFATRLQAIASEKSDVEGGSPYKGLIAYRLSDAEIFFGRSVAIANLLKRLGRGALTVLHSESGAGKSSLLQAGIQPRLIGAGHLPLSLRPYNANPTYTIKRAFIPDLGQTPWLATAPLREFLRQVSEVLGPKTALYIILDQAEELFTQLGAEDRAEFVAELADCVNDESLPVRWLLSMRTEFFGNLANFRPQIQDPFANDYRLNRLNRAEAGEVITEPARRHGIAFEDGLVEQLLNDLSAGADELPPPQIQLVCSGLYDNLPDGKTSITRAQYAAAGGATGILREHLARVLGRDLKPAQRPIAQRLFEALITANGRRAVRKQSELIADFKASQLKDLPPETVQAVLNQLVDSRLLRAQEQEADPTQAEPAYELASGLSPEMTAALTYELAHDYLLDQIKLDPEAQARKAAQELLEQETRTYERYQTLLSPERLAVIAPHRAALRLTLLAEELLAKSEAEVQREQRAEEARRQKELKDAQKLAESALARARAERRGRLLTIGMLIAALTLVGVLSYDPVRRAILRQQAMGPALISIPESEIMLGDSRYTNDDPSYLPRGSYIVEAFEIEPYEVTNERYLLCVKSGNCSLPIAPSSSYSGDANTKLPVVNITAVQASQFCEWLGRRLPSDLQWERAARFTDERIWPWGNFPPSVKQANFYYEEDPILQPIGQYESGKSPEGIYDLAGNVWEWTRSAYFSGQPDLDLNSTTQPDAVSARGGGYDSNFESMKNTIAFRNSGTPFAPDGGIGFRCISK